MGGSKAEGLGAWGWGYGYLRSGRFASIWGLGPGFKVCRV